MRLSGRPQVGTVFIDTDSAPRVIHCGESLLEERLPVGTRVVYPNPPIAPVPDPHAAIRHAIEHPLGCDPLSAQLRPGMRVTIAMDDISLPLPPMATPDVRQIALEVLLPVLAEQGVDDVHLLVANSLHRKMTEGEMRRAVGPEIHREFYPDRYYCHDAEDEQGLVHVGTTPHGERLRLNRRACESDLLVYVNINLVPMDGGHKSVTVGLCDYESLRPHHEPQTILDSDGYMDPPRSELSRKCDRMGKLVDGALDVFHLETVLNNRMYGDEISFLARNEDDFDDADRLKLRAARFALDRLPWAARRAFFQRIPAPYGLIGCWAGRTEPVHERTLERCFEQYAVGVEGQCDVLIAGIPFISPYNVNSVLNPVLVQVMGPGYLFNLYRGRPLVRRGGVLILAHPCYDEFDAAVHPSYVEFFRRLLPETRDAFLLRERYEEDFARDPRYVAAYRFGHAYHGAHPFFMWYWGENGRRHLGRIIVVGAENGYVPAILGWDSARSLDEAIAMARSHAGRSASITMLHLPPIVIADGA
ncbi:MAG TPA: lactate racemase domain-containing protein [Vicinamibacteria bacterium]|nr:lactate racemase domain-containing protein [Vicinamibacteria bacterium]